MRKKFLVTILILATLGIAGVAQAQVSSANLWKLVSNAIFPVKSTWEFGSATSRIQKGWFNNLDANNATIGSIGVSGSVAGDMVVSGQIRNATGTQAAPSYSFNSDTNSGLYSGGADILKFANGGADSLTILANGNMGVATVTPTYKMDINGTLRANSTITFNSLASTTSTLVAASTAGTLSSIANNSSNWNDAYANRITGAVAPLALSSNSLSIPAASASVNGYLATSTFATFNNKVSSQWTTNGSNVYYTTGSVGIGTSNPVGEFSILSTGISGASSSIATWDSRFSIFGPNAGSANGAALALGYDSANDSSAVFSLAPGSAWKPIYFNAASYNFNIGGGNTKLTISSTGNVGISTTTPTSARLVVVPSGTYSIDAGAGRIGNLGTPALDTDAATVGYVKSIAAGTSSVPTVGYWTASGANIYNANSGNIGIGTNSPDTKLDIVGNTGNEYITIRSSASSANAGFIFKGRNGGIDNQASVYANWTGGLTFIPSASNPIVHLKNQATPNNSNIAGIDFDLNANNYYNSTFARVSAQSTDNTYGAEKGDLVFSTTYLGNLTEKMKILSNGNVGIGTTGPTEKLEVSGNIKATGYKSSDGTIGTSTTINVRKADDTGACTITVKNGLITTTTCP